MKPVGSAEVNSHFGLLGLGVAPKFLQKVRARPEILTNKLGLLPPSRSGSGRASRFALLLNLPRRNPRVSLKKRGGVLVNFFELCTQKHTALMLLFSHFYRKKNHESSVFLYQNLSFFFTPPHRRQKRKNKIR